MAGGRMRAASQSDRQLEFIPSDPMETTATPPLKWAGGKRWLVPHLLPLWEKHQHRRLIEPFCGGLAVTLGLMPTRAVLNDINPHAINFYRWLKRGLAVTIEMKNDEAHFYEARRRFNELILEDHADSAEAAQLFYYLNRTGYNGLCRFNRKGGFNVPFGSYRSISYRTDFSEFTRVFAAWDFSVGDFQAITVEPQDFLYADPPYDVEFTQYSKEAFGWEEQQRLALWLKEHPGPVVASNQATDRILALYADCGFDIITLDAPRRISCTGDRSPALEMLATRNI